MKEFGTIFLSWRKGLGERRHIVGKITQSVTRGVEFSYIQNNVQKAFREGFAPYTDFPDVSKIYIHNVEDIFSQRLTKPDRPDVSEFYDFWEINPKFKDDNLYLLAHTMGLLPTDNFEFLADYNPTKELCFISDLASVGRQELKSGSLLPGDELCIEFDINNEFDQWAIKVFKDDLFIGFVKQIHSKVFHRPKGKNLKLRVKAVDQNGKIRRVFVRVSF